METVQLATSALLSWPKNPRTDIGDVASLAESIKANGLLLPLIVRPAYLIDGRQTYEVIAGNRRLAALRRLSWEGAPCIVLDDETSRNETRLLEIATTENFMRERMHPMDECEAFELMAREGKSETDIALQFGVTERYVGQRRLLATLPQAARDAFRAGKIELREAIALARVEKADTQTKLLKKRLKDGGSLTWMIGQHVDQQRFYVINARFDVAASGLKTAEDLFDEDDDGEPKGAYFVDKKAALKKQLEVLPKLVDEIKARNEFAFVHLLPANKPLYNDYNEVFEPERAPKGTVGIVLAMNTADGTIISRHARLKSEVNAAERKEKKKAAEKAPKKLGAKDDQQIARALEQDIRECHRLALAVYFAANPDDFAKHTRLLPLRERPFTGHQDIRELGERVQSNLAKMSGLAPRIASYIDGFDIQWDKLPFKKKLELGDLPWPKSLLERLPTKLLVQEAKAVGVNAAGKKKGELVELIWAKRPKGWVPKIAQL